MTQQNVLLKASKISKSFPGVKALDQADFTLYEGEIHALLGMNGAGKSTLVKIIAGVQTLDSGELSLNGRPLTLHSVSDAVSAGIVVVHQERTLVPYLSVMENIMLGAAPSRYGFVDFKTMRAEAARILADLGIDLPLDAAVKELGAGERQLVDIMRALRTSPKVLILDEPTASLSRAETEYLFRILRRFKSKGIGIIFVSHRLDEVFEISDRTTILRDGKVVNVSKIEDITPARVAELMVGRQVSYEQEFTAAERSGTPLLQLTDLSGPKFHHVNLEIYPGEIVGLAGVVGSGRTELLETIVGFRKLSSGQMRIRGQAAKINSPAQALELGLVLVPEKRTEKGLMERQTVAENLSLPSLSRLASFGMLRQEAIRRESRRIVQELTIATPSIDFTVRNLSGGNKQKVAFGKWLLASQDVSNKVFLFDEPTEGVDVGAKTEMWKFVEKLAAQGAGIIVASSELEELAHLSHYYYIMRQGYIVGSDRAQNISQERLLETMLTAKIPEMSH